MSEQAETHINAFYAELAEAKREFNEVQGRIVSLEDEIRSRGGELPKEVKPVVDVPKEAKKRTSKKAPAKTSAKVKK